MAGADERVGWHYGLLVGGATMPASAGDFRLTAFGASAGKMLGPNTLAQVALTRDESREPVALTGVIFLTGAIQRWLSPRTWVRGGVGIGSIDTSELTEAGLVTLPRTRGGFVVLGAAGVELAAYEFSPQNTHGTNLMLDIQYEHRTLPFTEGAPAVGAIMIGINFYRR
ncbi:MAG: hypothetical protein IT184_17740 [Acidobacteria bacterium]|nr:hypothetical protein [Acidobacteriota bacterium]